MHKKHLHFKVLDKNSLKRNKSFNIFCCSNKNILLLILSQGGYNRTYSLMLRQAKFYLPRQPLVPK